MTRDECKKVFDVCSRFYGSKNMEHAARVCDYVQDDCAFAFLSDEQKYFVVALACAHDLLEDTKCELCEFDFIADDKERIDFCTDLILLTQPKGVVYYDYVKTLVESRHAFAIMVKRADMKDHLTLKETLTQRLKDKYYPVLPMLMGPHYVWR